MKLKFVAKSANSQAEIGWSVPRDFLVFEIDCLICLAKFNLLSKETLSFQGIGCKSNEKLISGHLMLLLKNSPLFVVSVFYIVQMELDLAAYVLIVGWLEEKSNFNRILGQHYRSHEARYVTHRDFVHCWCI